MKNENKRETFSQRLKELRLERKLLQQELAKELFVSKSTVSGWEVGRNQPSYELLIEIADYFDVTVDYLIGRKGY